MIESEVYEQPRSRLDQPMVHYDDEPFEGLSEIEEELWFLIRDIMDPEFPYTLSQLRIISPKGVFVSPELRFIRISFTPTVPHCSLSTIIGLAIRHKIDQEFLLEEGWKLSVKVSPGSHDKEVEINKQLSDKERVYAALENPKLIQIINSIIRYYLEMMDSYSNRTSSIFTTFTTVLFTFATLNHFTYYFHPTSPTASVEVSKVSNLVFSEFKNYNADQVKLDIDLSVDLRSEYSWNVNQLYLFVVASYETSKNTRNEIVVFDKIVRDKKDYKFDLKQHKIKYLLRDEYKNTLAGKKVTLSVKYQVMPIFGLMWTKDVPRASSEFVVPKEYSKK